MVCSVLLIVVEDDEQRRAFNDALRHPNHHLVFVHSLDEGCERLPEVKPQVAIAPGGRFGSELIQTVRKVPEGANTSVVFFGPPEEASSTWPETPDGWLSYPLQQADVRAVLAPLIIYGRSGAEYPAANDAQTTVVGYRNPFYNEGDQPTDIEARRVPLPVVEVDLSSEHDTPQPVPAVTTIAPVDDAQPSVRPAAQRRGLDESQLGQRLVQRIRSLHSALGEADYYQLLGVEPTADEDKIHTAWFELSIELHPDRFFLLRSGELKAQIYAVFRQVAEAHRVLGDTALREEYDQQRTLGHPANITVDEEFIADAEGQLSLVNPADASFARRAEAAFERGALQEARFYLCALLAYDASSENVRRALVRVEDQLGPSV